MKTKEVVGSGIGPNAKPTQPAGLVLTRVKYALMVSHQRHEMKSGAIDSATGLQKPTATLTLNTHNHTRLSRHDLTNGPDQSIIHHQRQKNHHQYQPS